MDDTFYMDAIFEIPRPRVLGSNELIRLTDDAPQYSRVYLHYTAVRDSKDDDFTIKLEAIYRSHKSAQGAAWEWICEKQDQNFRNNSHMDDLDYCHQTNFRCVRYHTPLPEKCDKCFWTWTEEKDVL